MGILLFELFRNPLFMGILNKWETLVPYGRKRQTVTIFMPGSVWSRAFSIMIGMDLNSVH